MKRGGKGRLATRILLVAAMGIPALFGSSHNARAADGYFTLGGNSNYVHNGIPYALGAVALNVRHTDTELVLTDSIDLSGLIATEVHIIENAYYANNAPNGALVGRIDVHYQDGTLDSLDLIMGQNIAEWAYDRPEIQCCLYHSKVPPAYSFWTNQGSEYYYWGHQFHASIVTEAKALASLELVLGPGSYGHPSCPESCGGAMPDWFGIGVSAITLEVPPVVVLVHGYDNNSDSKSCGMEPLAQYIENPTNMGGLSFDTECLEYRTREGVVAGAQALKQRIDAIGLGKVDIVAHSMGGLVARYYIEKLGGRDKVRSLTMLGTPNWGTAVAKLVCRRNGWYQLPQQDEEFDRGACDLIPFSPVILDLNVNPGSHAGVSYNVITGHVGNRHLQVPNDCVVPGASAAGLGFPMTTRPVSHVTMSGVKALVTGCTAPGEIDDAGVHDQVRDILLASSNFASSATELAAQAMATPTPPPDEPAPDALAWRNGVIANGGTVEVPVTLPDGQTSATFRFQMPSSADVTLTYSLLRPGGTPVNQSDPDVAFVAGPALWDFDETRYAITSPTPGTWVMRVVGANVPAGGWPFELQALVPGRISVAASVGSDHFIVGEPIAISADVAIAGTPVADATVDATVTKPDGTSAAVPLASGETGTYGGSFAETSECDVFQVLVTAGGTDGSTPFSRQDLTLAVVSVPGEPGANPCEAAAAVGGVAEYWELEPSVRTSAHGPSAPDAFAVAGLATGAALLLAAGGWYARRRWRAG